MIFFRKANDNPARSRFALLPAKRWVMGVTYLRHEGYYWMRQIVETADAWGIWYAYAHDNDPKP